MTEPICVGCNRTADELPEYTVLAEDEGYESNADTVRGEEGTYNPENGHFYCTPCYIRAGQPLGVAP